MKPALFADGDLKLQKNVPSHISSANDVSIESVRHSSPDQIPYCD